MAYDPRTGITTYDEADVAADPSVDLAADVAPSTATTLPPAAPAGFFNAYDPMGVPVEDFMGYRTESIAAPAAPQFTGNAAIDWANQQAYNSYAWDPGQNDEGTYRAAGWQQGRPLDQVLYGAYGGGSGIGQNLDTLLKQISAASGNEGFDWLGAKAAFAQQHANQFGTGFTLDSPWQNVIEGIVANSGDPRIAQVWEQAGPEVKAQLADAYQKYFDYQKARDERQHMRELSVMAAPFAAWAGPAVAGMFGSAGAGLTASELALADIALGGAGGSAGAAALGAGFGAGLGMLSPIAAGATQGAISGLASGQPLQGALKGGLSAGLSGYGQPLLETGMQSVFDAFGPDINFADLGDPFKRTGMLGGGLSMDVGAGGLDPLSATESLGAGALGTGLGSSPLNLSPYELASTALPEASTAVLDDPFIASLTSGAPEMGLNLNAAPMGALGEGALGSGLTLPAAPLDAMGADALGSGLRASGMLSGASAFQDPYALTSTSLPAAAGAEFAAPQAPAPAPRTAPVTAEQVAKYAKIGAKLSGMFEGQGVPEGAPQRAEDQSDADYAATLADYIQVDAQALADMGLVPGTPEYYDYLMSQLDLTIEDMTGTIDVNAADLEQQLRGKTREELDSLRRALFVRGQLDQLMGSGSYTDPFTGRAEEVITNGKRVNPGVAAYHRGLGHTIEEFAGMTPLERERAIGGFLGRDADIYGMQARADAQAEQSAQAAAYLEDLKRRGMFSQSQAFPQFSLSMTGDPEMDQLLGMFSQ